MPVPVMATESIGLRAAPTPSREAMILEVRMRLQTEVQAAFKELLDAKDGEVRSQDRAASSTAPSSRGGFAVTREERDRLVDEMVHDVTGFGPIEPLLADPIDHRGHGQRPEPHLHRAQAARSSGSTRVFLNDEHVLRVIDRIIAPLGRRIDETSPRVDARLPDGSRVNAIIEPLSLIGPVITVRKFSHTPYTVDDLDPLRDGDARDVRVPAGLHRGQAQPLRVGRHGLGQDDDPQRPLVVHPRTTSGSSRSRTPPSSSSARTT